MLKISENNGTEEISLVTPIPGKGQISEWYVFSPAWIFSRPRNESHILITDWPTTQCMLSYWYIQQEMKSSQWWQPVTGTEMNPIFLLLTNPQLNACSHIDTTNRKWSHHSGDSLSQAQKSIPYFNYWLTHNSMHALILIQPTGNEVITVVTACHRSRNESHILITGQLTTQCMLSYWYNQ